MLRQLALAVCALLVTACSSLDSNGPADVIGPEWRVVRLEADAVPESAGLTLRFEAAQMSGHSGVNAFHGPANIGESGDFVSGPFAMTRRAGPAAAMRLESLLLVALERADRWRIDGDELHLASDANSLVVAKRAE